MSLDTRGALDIIAASRERRVSGEAWLSRLLEVAAPALPAGVLLALEVNLSNAELESDIVRGANADAAHAACLRRGHGGGAPAWCVKATYGSGKSWISLRECVPDGYFQRADWLEELRGFGLQDMLGVVSKQHRPGEPSCALFSLCGAPAHATRAERRLWDQVSVHLGAAQRLRLVADATPAAIFSSEGRLLHAEGEAVRQRDHLRELVQAWDAAHARIADRDAERTLHVWTELASGRWALVDHFDSDGQRYVVVRRNPSTDGLRRLTAREQQVAEFVADGRTNHWIALELELAPATMSEHVKNVQRKLGVRSRYELIQLVNVARAGAEP